MKKLVYLVLFSYLVSACSGIQTRRSNQAGSDGPFDEGDSQSQTKQDTQEPVERQKKKMALVLGPGAYKTFAYPSFLKAMSQSGVQVDEIVGIEWGALSAAFYANNAKPHEAEWKVFKLKKDQLEDSSIFGKSKVTEVSNFREYLKTNLGSKSMSSTAIPFDCPVLHMKRGSVDWSKRGALWRRVEICMSSAPKFKPTDDQIPSLFALEQVANNLKRKGYEIIIFVNVLGSNDKGQWSKDWVTRAYWAEAQRHIWQAKGQFTDVFDIDTGKYAPFDFKAKNGLKGVGERAGKKAARELVEKYNL